MFRILKKKLYFFVAYYFRFFAIVQLRIWKPRIVVVTGSSGKTSLLHLIQSQIGERAKYSHHANSMYGIPFDILDLKRKKLVLTEWLFLFLLAPFKAFKKPFLEKIYIVEVDCDRPGEGKFLASLLNPEVTLWLNSTRTHSVNFDWLVSRDQFATIEQAIAHEFGYLLEKATKLAILNADSDSIQSQISRAKVPLKMIKQEQLESYVVSENSTEFVINSDKYEIHQLLPKEFFYSIAMTKELMEYLQMEFDPTFPNFYLPPGRSSKFTGIKNTTIIDSSYNATPDGMYAILQMFDSYLAEKKWLVLGDMIELGVEEQEEHEKLAKFLATLKISKIILIGPRLIKYTEPMLKSLAEVDLVSFEQPRKALDYILANLEGGETILFKGARFLEGIIEHLLLDTKDIESLCRREKIWQKRRKQWAL